MPRLPEDNRLRYHTLNKRQLAFVRNYNGDLEEAAQAAGYRRKDTAGTVHRLLGNAEIAALIAEKQRILALGAPSGGFKCACGREYKLAASPVKRVSDNQSLKAMAR